MRVRFLIDGVGAIFLPRNWFKRMHAAGAETAIFSPLLAREDPGSAQPAQSPQVGRSPTASACGPAGAISRLNISAGPRAHRPGRDLSFDLDGPVAASAANQFEVDWVAAGGKPAARAAVAAAEDVGSRAQFLPSGPDQTEDTVRALLIDACFHATERMLAVTPYFVPDSSLETAIRLAARRGVKVHLCIPAKSNHRLADFVRNRSLRALATRRRVDPPAADHEPCQGRGVRPRPRDLRLAESRFAQPAPQLRIGGGVLRQARDRMAGELDHRSDDGSRPRSTLARPGLWRDLAEGLVLTLAYQL